MALIDNLIAYWSLDEVSGGRADSHGGNDLTDNNFTGSATGKINNAADLEQMSQHYLSIADSATIGTGDIDCSFSIWVKPESLVGFPMILSKGSEVGTDREYALYVDTSDSNRLVWQYGTFGAGHVLTSVTGLTVGVWYHIVVGYDSVNNLQFMYINGVAETPISNTEATIHGTDPLQVGAGTSQGLYWDGLIDEVGFWKRVLTSSEVTELYNNGNGRSYGYIVGEAEDITVVLAPLVVNVTPVSPNVQVSLTVSLPVLSVSGALVSLGMTVGSTINLSPVIVGCVPTAPTVSYGNEVALSPLLIQLSVPTIETTGGVTPVAPILARTLDFSYTLNATLDFQHTLNATLDHGTP